MEKEQILYQIQSIFRQVMRKEELTINTSTNAGDIEEWDSLTHLQIIAKIEQHFNIKFNFREIKHFENVGDLCNAILNKKS